MQSLNKPCTAPCAVLAARQPSSRRTWAPPPFTSGVEPSKAARAAAAAGAQSAARRRSLRLACSAAQASASASAQEVTVREEEAGPCRLRLHITVPAAQVSAVYKQTIAEYRKEVKVPGFRKGKAPDATVIAEVGGKERVNNTVIATLLEATLRQALSKYNDVLIEESDSIDQNGAELNAKFDPKSDFEFSVSFDTMPTIKWKQPYRSIKVEVESAGDDESDAAAVEAKLEGLRKGGAQLRVVADRGLQRGDVAIIDIDILRPGTTDSLVGGARNGFRLDTSNSDATFIPGVAGMIEGMKVGEHREGPLTMPTGADFQPATLRGQDTTVSVTLNELFVPDLPTMDDAWAESVAPGCGGLAGLRAQLVEAQHKETDAETHKRIEDALLTAVADAVDCPVPESQILKLGQQEYNLKLQQALQAGQLSYEVVQQLATEQLLNEFIKKERPELERTQRGLMAFAELVRAEGLSATLPEIQAEYESAVAEFEKFGQEYDKERLMEQVEQQIEGRKAMDWMLANLEVEVMPYSVGK